MIPHPAALDAAYGTAAWAPFTRVTLYTPTTTGGETQIVADAVDGMLTMSDTNWPRTTLEMTIPAAITGAQSSAPTSAYGGRVVVEMGATLAGVLYTFQVCDLDVTEVFLERLANAWTIRAASQEARVDQATPYIPVDLYEYANIGAGKTSDGVQRLISEVIPGYDVFAPLYPMTKTLTLDDTITTSDEFQSTDGLWDLIDSALDATGGEAYFRYDRLLVLRDDPVIGSPVGTFKVGVGGTITAYRDVNRWAFNAVHTIYRRKSDGTLLIGKWENTSGASKTRVQGPYGRHTRVEDVTVSVLPTQVRADRRAASIAKRAAAPFRRVEFDAVPAAWIEPGDTVAVQLTEGGTTNMLVSGVRVPLTQLDAMTVTLHDSGL